jgi:hypothetical protein
MLGSVSPGAVTALIVVCSWVLLMGGTIWWVVRKGLQSTPWRVVRVLTEGRGPYKVTLSGGFRTTWNPAKPLGSNNGISGPGVGVYRLDDSGEVHLTWTPKDGVPREHTGPIPDRVRPNSEQTVRMRRMWHRFIYLYLATLVGGFLLGFAVAGGDIAHRLAGGSIGVLVAILALALGGTVLSGVRSFRHQPNRT